jgi:Cutinase/PKD domain
MSTRAMPTRAVRYLRILLTGALLLLLVALPSVETPEAHAATTACAPVTFLASRGSGQTSPAQDTTTAGVGQPLYDFINNFNALQAVSMGSSSANTLWANPYKAVSVSGVTGFPNAVSSGVGWGWYKNSVAGGQTALTKQLNAVLSSSCAGITKIILAGFSQGAQVTANVYQSLTAAQQADITGVALFGDPLFNPQSPGDMGDFNPQRQGVLAHPKSRVRAAFPDNGEVLSFCRADDAICQGFVSFSPFGVAGLGGHSDYNEEGDAASPIVYTQRAAEYFTARAGVSSAGIDPTALITPPGTVYAGRTVELSGAESTDSDGDQNLTYAWDLNGSGVYSAPSPEATTTTVFKTPGTYTVGLRVTTPQGAPAVTTAAVTVVADPGTPQAPIDLSTLWPATNNGGTITANYLSSIFNWQAPASGPTPTGYEVYGSDGEPLADIVGDSNIMGISGGSLTLPGAGWPSTIEIEAVDNSGEGGTVTEQLPTAPNTIAAVGGPAVSVTPTEGVGAISFPVVAGQEFSMSGTLSSTDAKTEANVDLLDPSGTSVQQFLGTPAANKAGLPQIDIGPITPTTTGLYTLDFSLVTTDNSAVSGTLTMQVTASTSSSAIRDPGASAEARTAGKSPALRACGDRGTTVRSGAGCLLSSDGRQFLQGWPALGG